MFSYYFDPVHAFSDLGLSQESQVWHARMLGIPLEELCGCPTRSVYSDVSFSAGKIHDNTEVQSFRSYVITPPRGLVTDIWTSIQITHPSQGDLKVVLEAPDGTEAVLHNRQGGQTPYASKTYMSSTNPALASLVGQESAGKWWLTIGDYSEGRTGMIDFIRIELTFIPLPPADPVRTISSNGDEPYTPIPDDTDGQDTSYVLDIQDGGTVSNIFLTADITHEYVGDLRVVLTAPDGSEAVLHSRLGGHKDHLLLDLTTDNWDPLLPLVGMNATGRWTLSVGDYSYGHTGTVHEWGITVWHEKPPPELPVPGYSHIVKPDLSIPDDTDGQDTSSVISIPHEGTLSEIYVSADISHTYRGDLRVVLTAPDGSEAVLHNRLGGGQDNVSSVYSSEDTDTLARLIGTKTAGDWILSVGDYGDGDVGVLNQWGLTLKYD